MDKDTGEEIVITHYTNPELFWYHKVDDQDPAFFKFQRIEESLQCLIKERGSWSMRQYHPVVGEIVAVAFVSWRKYIRAQVEYIAQYSKSEDEYVVWALDYGFPFQTKLCHIQKLPDSYKQLTDHIRLGAIANVIPAELAFDFGTLTSQMMRKDSWLECAVKSLEKVLKDATSISFIELGFSAKQRFGDLKITDSTGDEFFVSDYLVKSNYAEKCVDISRAKMRTFNTTKFPDWLINNMGCKIIQNDLNNLKPLNTCYVYQGKLALFPSLTESSDDMLPKQSEVDAACPIYALKDTAISFHDSVSVSNCKDLGRTVSTDKVERRKKYEGKGLPSEPALDVLKISPEKKKPLEEEESDTLNKSGGGCTSWTSRRTKALIELRKKWQAKMNSSTNENLANKEVTNVSSPSETRTEEFASKMMPTQSVRIKRLIELRKKQFDQEAPSNKNVSGNNVVERIENISATTKSVSDGITGSQICLFKMIREKHSEKHRNEAEQRDA